MYAQDMAIKIKNWLRKSGPKKSGRKTGRGASTVNPNKGSKFQAVAISSGLNDCCREVKALQGKRFLIRSAPVLPLPNCDLPECRCRYVKYDDRRQEPRRDSEYGIASSFVRDVERRGAKRGRRSTDT